MAAARSQAYASSRYDPHPMPPITLTDNPTSLIALLLLALISFPIGLKMPPLASVPWRQQSRALTVGVALQWLGLPLLTAMLIVAVPVPSGASDALWLVAATPGGYVLLTFALTARSDLLTALGLSLTTTALKLLLTPLLWWIGVRYLLPAATAAATFDRIAATMSQVVPALVLPLLMGWLIQQRWPAAVPRLARVTLVLTLLMVLAGLVDAADALRPGLLLDWPPLLALVIVHHALVCLLAYGLAWLAHLAPAQRRSVVLACSTFNASLAIPLALLLFPRDGIALLTLGFWALWRVAIGTAIAFYWRWRPIR